MSLLEVAFPTSPARPAWPAGEVLGILPPERLALAVAQRLVATIGASLERQDRFLLAPSAGRTFGATYALLAERFADAVDWRRVTCVQMDEYAGLGNTHPLSFATQLRTQLVEPLGMGGLVTFHDEQGHLHGPPEAQEARIAALGGLDCVLHGLGHNGHVAFNEPGDGDLAHTRHVRLAAPTLEANGVDFADGVTLGLRCLLSPRSSVVALLGAAKRDAARMLFFGEPGANNPAACLREAAGLAVYLDQEACPEPGLIAAHGVGVPGLEAGIPGKDGPPTGADTEAPPTFSAP